ncbi:MAG: hypothetical protein AB7K36_05755, partial [Chloroflexota bacterium]
MPLGGTLTAPGTSDSSSSQHVAALSLARPRQIVRPGIISLPRRAIATPSIEAVTVMALSVIVFAVYVWASRYWIDLIDEGYFVYLGSRVHAGDLPYRDFDSYYTPGIFYLFSWMFDLFGVSVEPIRVLMSGMRVLWGLLLFSLARRVAPWPFAL